MKKLILIALILSMALLFAGCSESAVMSEDSKLVTACFASQDGLYQSYGFYVSTPSGQDNSEDGASAPGSKLYVFFAGSLKDAVDEFEKNCGKADFSHMSMFLTDIGYLSEQIKTDMSYINKRIKVNPLIKIFVTINEPQSIFEAINTGYNSSPRDYISAAFNGERKKLLCTLSELFFSVCNPIYMASVPYISAEEVSEPIVTHSGFYLYDGSGSGVGVYGEDFEILESHIRKYGKTFDFGKVSFRNGGFVAEINAESKAVAGLAERFRQKNYDILNVRYYGRKCFLTYEEYEDIINNYDNSDIEFTVR